MTESVSEEVGQRIDALADRLAQGGDLRDRSWRQTLREVPRHLFIPPVAWADPYKAAGFRIDRDGDPDAWWEAVYSDQPIITQLDDGAAEIGTGDGDYSSSCSAPGVVLSFLELLRPFAGHRVLEVGTGTGWTAGLLSARIGEQNVTSVEVDPSVAKQAAANLEAAGYAPNLIVGDACTVRPDGGPFDLVHVTCAVRQVPHVWVEQTRPGGVIVLPYSPEFGYGYLARLDVLADGTAMGRFHGSAGYMVLRSQRLVKGRATAWVKAGGEVAESATRFDPRTISFTPGGGLEAAVAGLVPGVRARLVEDEKSIECTLWLLEASGPGGSWASVDYEPGRDTYEVQQAGDRRLFDELEAAYFTWVSWGRPGLERFGLTVTPDGQQVWLDDPGRIIGDL